MAVNQPKITDDQVDNSWKLEVTNQINSEEARINNLLSRIEQLESATIAAGSGRPGITYSFADGSNGSFTVTPSDGNPQVVTTGTGGNLQLTNYVQAVQSNQLEYTFGGTRSLLSVTPHQVYIGGQKLIETVDYIPSDTVNGRITLTSQPDLTGNSMDPMQQLMIELSIWSL